MQLPRREIECTRDLCNDRHDIGTCEPIDRGNHLGIKGKRMAKLVEKHAIDRMPERLCFRVRVLRESLCKSIVELQRHLGERKQAFGELGRGQSEEARSTRGMKSDSEGVNRPVVIEAKGFRQRADDGAVGLEAAPCRADKPDRIAEVKTSSTCPSGRTADYGMLEPSPKTRQYAVTTPARPGDGEPFVIANFHHQP